MMRKIISIGIILALLNPIEGSNHQPIERISDGFENFQNRRKQPGMPFIGPEVKLLDSKAKKGISSNRTITRFSFAKTTQKKFHTQGVTSLIYSKSNNLFFSGSLDASIGVWNDQLSISQKYENPIFPVYAEFNGEARIASQVQKLKGIDKGRDFFLAAYLMGQYLRIYRFSVDENMLIQIVNLSGAGRQTNLNLLFGVKGFDFVPQSDSILFTYGVGLEVYDYVARKTLSSMYEEKRFWRLIHILDEKYFLAVEGSQSQSQISPAKLSIMDYNLKLRTGTDESGVVVKAESDVSGLSSYQINLILLLRGLNPQGSTKEQRAEIDKQCALFDPQVNAKIRVINNCWNFQEYKILREYEKIHGYYSILSAAVIFGTRNVATGGGDGFVRIWDFFSTETTPEPGYEINYGASIFSLSYLEEDNKLYIGKNINEYDQLFQNPLVRESLCMDSKCLECSTSETICSKCVAGTSLIEGKCEECGSASTPKSAGCRIYSRPWLLTEEDPLAASNNQMLRDATDSLISIKHSSKVFKLEILNTAYWQESFPPALETLLTAFQFQIQDVDPASYNSSYLTNGQDLFLTLNFSSDFNNKNFSIWVKNPVLIRTVAQYDSLLLINNTVEIEVSGRQTVTEETLRGFGTAGSVAGTTVAAFSLLTAAMLFFNLCLPIGIGAYLLSFFQVVEIIARFKYINVNFGAILSAFFEGLDEAFELPSLSLGMFFDSEKFDLFEDTRRKLSFYDLPVLSLATIPMFSLVYLVSQKPLKSHFSASFSVFGLFSCFFWLKTPILSSRAISSFLSHLVVFPLSGSPSSLVSCVLI